MRLAGWLAILALAISLTAGAQEKKPNTLTSKEISDGWLLLFDGETTFGWKSQGDAKWHVKNGVLVADGGKGTLSTTTEFADFEMSLDILTEDSAAGGVNVRESAEKHGDFIGPLFTKISGKQNQWKHLRITAEGDKITYFYKAQPLEDTRKDRLPRGVVTLGYLGGGTAKFRNIRLRPLNLKRIFNGKDLSGWHIMPNRKSVITVTQEGWLNIKGGSGDVQTDAQWGDFTLQLECISNGNHCNSGIFFRSALNEYELGYEDQINNRWEGDDRTKPTDFGTGAIYRRQVVRKVVSSDHEWFTMTLIAHGLHFGSWVNGYMVADFTDMRPPDETNARKGSRIKPGCLSLQGHDTDGDLSFRNIRVAEMPAAKP